MQNEFDDSYRQTIEFAIEKYEQEMLSLPKNSRMDTPQSMSMNMHDLARLSPIELNDHILQLAKYSLFIQREINKHKAWERWCKSKLDELAAHSLPNIADEFGYAQRELIARHNHPLCRSINKFLREIRMKLDYLYDIPAQINNIAGIVRDTKFLVSRKEKAYDE